MAEEEQENVINHCPACNEAIDVSGQPPFAKILCPHCEEAVRVRTTLGNFQITRLLGEGGMSQVFLADDMTLDRQVALKVLHRDLSEDKALMALFEREAQLTASINHPNVVKVYKAGSEQGYFFIAMELVDKISLEELIAERGMLNESEVLDIAYDVASGLRTAYNGGLIHRDIKPGNILLTKDGTAKLVDFGLAIAHGDEDHVEDLWATPFYVPPEKLDGEPDDFRGDIYSLGATFFHALAGRPPFQANTASMEELKAIKAQPVTLHDHASHVSAMTGKLIDRMMAYQPESRPQSYDNLLEQIEAEQDRQPGSMASRARRQKAAAAAGAAATSRAKAGGPNWALLTGVGVAVLAAAGIGFAVLGPGDSGDPPLITDEERVLSAGDKAVAARFNEARSMLLQGRSAAAGRAFGTLLESPDLKQPTRSWAHFNAGLAALLGGDEAGDARKHFSSMAQAGGFDRTKAVEKEMADFFEKSGKALSGALPVMPETGASLKADSSESIALLAFGLKNWNHGQFKSAIVFFDAFDSASPREEWVQNYRALTSDYRSDYAAILSLPNPRMSMSDSEFDGARSRLEEARRKIKTGGAGAELVRKRTRRIEELLEAKKELASAPDPGPAPDPGNPGPESPPMEMTPEAKAEKARLAEALQGMRELTSEYRFNDVITQLNSLTFQTTPVRKMHQDSIAACEGAEAFVARLTQALSSGSFEGIVRRKVGTPLDARITAASRDRVVVDLGFGPNDLEVHKLAPDWLLEVAVNDWLTPSSSPPDSSWEPWAEAAWFAGMTGQQNEAGQFAGQILGKAPEFSERWTRLKGL